MIGTKGLGSCLRENPGVRTEEDDHTVGINSVGRPSNDVAANRGKNDSYCMLGRPLVNQDHGTTQRNISR